MNNTPIIQLQTKLIIMKYVSLISAILLLFLLVSCDKNKEIQFSDKIQGEWFVTKITWSNCLDSLDNETILFPNNCNFDDCLKYNISADGTFTIESKEQGILDPLSSGYWQGDESSFILCSHGFCDEGNVEFINDKIIINFTIDDPDCQNALFELNK